MSYLFCESHGEEFSQSVSVESDGDYIKIVYGPLSVDGYRCDRCNRPLHTNDTAYYIAYLSKNFLDPKGEKHYFSQNNVTVEIH